MRRLAGYNGPLSKRIKTDALHLEPFSMKLFNRLLESSVIVVATDGRIFGGKDFYLNKNITDYCIRIYRDSYLGGGAVEIPIDEILGMKEAY